MEKKEVAALEILANVIQRENLNPICTKKRLRFLQGLTMSPEGRENFSSHIERE
jgi:hypothetical protein